MRVIPDSRSGSRTLRICLNGLQKILRRRICHTIRPGLVYDVLGQWLLRLTVGVLGGMSVQGQHCKHILTLTGRKHCLLMVAFVDFNPQVAWATLQCRDRCCLLQAVNAFVHTSRTFLVTYRDYTQRPVIGAELGAKHPSLIKNTVESISLVVADLVDF